MKRQLQLFIVSCFIGGMAFSQADSTKVVEKPWKLKALFGLNGTQSSFVNWSAGGRNNLSVIGFISASANYTKNKWLWKNNLELALGGMIYLDKVGRNQGLQKTDDKIDFATNLGYKIADKWYVSLVGGFRTQFMDGFNYPNDSVSKYAKTVLLKYKRY